MEKDVTVSLPEKMLSRMEGEMVNELGFDSVHELIRHWMHESYYQYNTTNPLEERVSLLERQQLELFECLKNISGF